jgi:hypothetical protein
MSVRPSNDLASRANFGVSSYRGGLPVFERPFDLRRESQVQPRDTLDLRTADPKDQRATVHVDDFDRPAEMSNGPTDKVGDGVQASGRGYHVAQKLAFVSPPMPHVSQSGGDVRPEEGHRLIERADAAAALGGGHGKVGDIRREMQTCDELRLPSAQGHEDGMDQALGLFGLLA